MTHDHKSPQEAYGLRLAETASRLEQIEARANAATPGPWECMGETVFGTYSYIRKCKSHWPITETARNKDHEKNGMFIANAREDIPWLISEVRRLHAENRMLRDWVIDISLDPKPPGVTDEIFRSWAVGTAREFLRRIDAEALRGEENGATSTKSKERPDPFMGSEC